MRNRKTKLEEQVSHLVAGTPTASAGTNGPENRKPITLTDRYEEAPLLYQNVPNPFSQTTTIRYYIPEGTEEAQMVFTSLGNGKVLKAVTLGGVGHGELVTNIGDLPSGDYAYTLVLDGMQTLTRQMVLAK